MTTPSTTAHRLRVGSSTIARFGIVLGLLACAVGLPLAGLSAGEAAAAPATRPRLVMCWYMVCFGNTVDFYKQEMQLAQSHGIDGFLLDVGDWRIAPEENNYTESARRMFEAAKQLNSGFKLAMTPEYSVQPAVESLVDMVTRFHGHPNYLQLDGRDVMCTYGIDGGTMTAAKEALKAKGIETAILANPFPPRFEYAMTPERVLRFLADTPIYDGLMNFDVKPVPEIVRENAIRRRVTKTLGKLYGAAVIPCYNSSNLEDYHGLAGYGAMWEGAIRDGADWISLVIWNDYNEDSNLMPYRWPGGSEKDFFDRDNSFLEATAYYASWFKTGARPTITQDKLIITHRTRSKWLRQVYDAKTKTWSDACLRPNRYDQIHDNVQDAIYIDTFLTAPATVVLTVGSGKPLSFDLPAGVGHAEAPMTTGVPTVALRRVVDGKPVTLAEVTSRREIVAKATEENSPVGTSQHLLFRTWASGTAIGPAKRVEIEGGTLLGDAKVVKDGAIAAVENTTTDGSGVRVPVSGLRTGTYNVRIVYSNSGESDVRLTLSADGPARGAQEYPHFIPAWLPPTGAGAYRTTSFLWTLYETTSYLQIGWESGRMFGQMEPAMDDRGVARIDAIELVACEPFVAGTARTLAYPELVPIPGGSFTMGGDAGEPDEQPARKVAVSSFAIGRHEVTNAEFERFMPAHAEARTSLSWRDREPVIAVSWMDAITYCNWLSEKVGLKPSYREVADAAGAKTWEADLAGEGFRLPTEAEWEYVASGRRENRPYPWGDAAPVPQVHGNFIGRTALDIHRVPTSSEGGGAVVVGSYPAGASRDGVMDLAGNVGEWCSDWYGPYVAGEQKDPLGGVAGNFRCLRGGSWGWYGWSQRSADREFNSQNYPGHCYYGFRVALPDAGWRKLGAKP